MDLKTKIETELAKCENDLKNNTTFQQIKFHQDEIAKLQIKLEITESYIKYKTLKNLLSETTAREVVDQTQTADYKVREYTHEGVKGKRSKWENHLKDTSHYAEMLDFLEAHLELDPGPIDIQRLYNIIVEAGYEVGGKRPPHTLSAFLSHDPRFTATNKGWVLTEKVKSDTENNHS